MLRVLEGRGLANAERARLSLLGLAQAARLPALGLQGAPSKHAVFPRASVGSKHAVFAAVERRARSARSFHARAKDAISAARQQSRLRDEAACFDGASAAPPLRRCAGDSRPELKRARRTS